VTLDRVETADLVDVQATATCLEPGWRDVDSILPSFDGSRTLRRCREEWTSHYGEQDTEGWGGDTTGVTLMNPCPEWVPKA